MKIGLVLSGGGARGLAHIGLLQGLNDLSIQPHIISGTSSGALVGALYAAGYTPKQILELVKDHTPSNVILMAISGFFSASGLLKILESAIPKNSFESLRMPFFVTATDINAGIPVSFSEGPLHQLLVASSSIPGLFTPVKHGERYLVDGGVAENLPVACIRHQCDKVIGSHVNHFGYNNYQDKGKVDIIERCFHMAIADTVRASARLCDVLIQPDLRQYNMFEMKYAREIYEVGYKAVIKESKSLEKLAEKSV